MTIGDKIKKIRTFRKMTQKELSEKIGLTDQHRIVQYEKGVRVPKKNPDIPEYDTGRTRCSSWLGR